MTDHKAEAETLFNLGSIPREGKYWFATDTDTLLAAQVQATLYLAEQQRIANLIALAADDDMTDPTTGTWQDGFWESARQQITEGLGL